MTVDDDVSKRPRYRSCRLSSSAVGVLRASGRDAAGAGETLSAGAGGERLGDGAEGEALPSCPRITCPRVRGPACDSMREAPIACICAWLGMGGGKAASAWTLAWTISCDRTSEAGDGNCWSAAESVENVGCEEMRRGHRSVEISSDTHETTGWQVLRFSSLRSSSLRVSSLTLCGSVTRMEVSITRMEEACERAHGQRTTGARWPARTCRSLLLHAEESTSLRRAVQGQVQAGGRARRISRRRYRRQGATWRAARLRVRRSTLSEADDEADV